MQTDIVLYGTEYIEPLTAFLLTVGVIGLLSLGALLGIKLTGPTR